MTKNKTSKSVKKLVITSLLFAIMLVLQVTNLGIITLPFSPIAITILHIPVIIGACILGPLYGGVLGFLFGLLSFFQSIFAPIPTSFLFNPFYSVGEFHGNFGSLIICFVPRILIGVFAGLLFEKLYNSKKKSIKSISAPVCGLVGSLTNTILVLGFVGIFFADQYLAATKANEALLLVIGGVILTNGIPEAIVAAIVTSAIIIPVKKSFKF